MILKEQVTNPWKSRTTEVFSPPRAVTNTDFSDGNYHGPKKESEWVTEIGGNIYCKCFKLWTNSSINSSSSTFIKFDGAGDSDCDVFLSSSPTPSPPSPGGGRTITVPNPFGGPPLTITLPGPYRADWKLKKESTDPDVQGLLDRAKSDADSYTRGNLRIWLKPPNDEEVVVLAGRDVTEEPHLFVIAEDPDGSGKTGWINDEVSPPIWERFEDY